jgi:dGTPase
MHKTQVFLSPEGDHYRTRLTHTLEVAQISRTIARALRLNEDLTEAIALGHDLGHTPFGHIGEEALTECFQELQKEKKFPKLLTRFEHNFQSLRVVEVIERGGSGLNLTWEVKDGIANHTGMQTPQTLEGQIVRISDRIAYINHDIDDALRADIISFKDIPQAPLALVGKGKSARINSLVSELIKASLESDSITMTPPYAQAMNELREFLFEKVYVESIAKAEDAKAKGIIKKLFFYYLEKPDEMPPEFHPSSQDELPQRVCDYVAGMTDRYALRVYENLFLPKPWMV